MIAFDELWRTWALIRDPLTALPDIAQEGDVLLASSPVGRVWVLHHPTDVHQVLVKDFRKFRKDVWTQQLDDVLGNGLLTSEGQDWRRHRRLVTPAFGPAALPGYAATMVECAEASIAEWGDRTSIDAHAFTSALTLDVVARTLFGADLGDAAAAISGALDDYMRWYMGFLNSGFPLPAVIPTPANLARVRALRVLDETVNRLVASASPEDATLIGRLLAARDEEGGLSAVQLRDEAITLLMAGHETTAGWLLFALVALAEHPGVEERVHAELDAVLGGRSPTLDDLPSLPYTRRVLLEVLRLTPPAWAVGRETVEPIEVGGKQFEPGDQVWIGPWSIHRDPRWYSDPLEFRPDRWLELEGTLPKGAFLPFGAGPRMCVGKRFAEMEAHLCLAVLAQRCSLRLAPGTKVELMPSITLRPAGAVPMVAHRRTAARRVA
ncbi:MAG: cytochrome P450 [Myxococcota bacterium]|jgi:cytochrome P450